MPWNWQNPDWPNFTWDRTQIAAPEEHFLLGSGVVIGSVKHLGTEDHDQLIVDLLSGEAVTTSKIEGEVLNRDSVQSSIQGQLGLATDKRRTSPAEQGIAEMMVDLYRSFQEPLSQEKLFRWHKMVTAGRRDLADVGRYRTSREPMQIVSGRIGASKIHFEAPPSERIPSEMNRFTSWFNRTGPDGEEPFPAITRAGIAHIYFESIHPFEDGNGRIGRAIAEKATAQAVGQPIFLSLATTILAHQKRYYEALERANRRIDLTEWLIWSAGIALDAQRRSIALIEFIISKTKLIDRLHGKINARQEKALLRMKKARMASKVVSVLGITQLSRGHRRPQPPAILPISWRKALSFAPASLGTHVTPSTFRRVEMRFSWHTPWQRCIHAPKGSDGQFAPTLAARVSADERYLNSRWRLLTI